MLLPEADDDGPGRSPQHVPHPSVAGLVDSTSLDSVAGRAFAGHEAEMAHELAGILKTAQDADLGDEVYGRDQAMPRKTA